MVGGFAVYSLWKVRIHNTESYPNMERMFKRSWETTKQHRSMAVRRNYLSKLSL